MCIYANEVKLKRHAWKDRHPLQKQWFSGDGKREIGWQCGRGDFNSICNDLLRRRKRRKKRRRRRIRGQKLRQLTNDCVRKSFAWEHYLFSLSLGSLEEAKPPSAIFNLESSQTIYLKSVFQGSPSSHKTNSYFNDTGLNIGEAQRDSY